MLDNSNLFDLDIAAQKTAAIDEALSTVRQHLGMDIGYLTEVQGDQVVFRKVDSDNPDAVLKVGNTRDFDTSYCRFVLSGEMPQLIPDTANDPLATSLQVTHQAPIGSHIGVPIIRPDGTPFGMFCCMSHTPKPSLNARDLDVMTMFARLANRVIHDELIAHESLFESRRRLQDTITRQEFEIALQPIVALGNGRPIGFEALSRFSALPRRGPDQWFAEAEMAGMTFPLEMTTAQKALSYFDLLPASTSLTLNASPQTVQEEDFLRLFADGKGKRIVVELTEHQTIDDLAALGPCLARLRADGVRIAIDDMGAGHSGLSKLLAVRPDMIKMDKSLIDGIENDTASRALCRAIVAVSDEMGATLVAEGIETQSTCDALRELNVGFGQGYLIARPSPAGEVANLPQYLM